ncbi:MAG TPA: flagellar biosynthesis anti-sigma factor FlgM [Candidatus Binatia bacterium]|nr:flagellar biosynthesis anti-sigma factor FlgM [Candidatus Binatia bacterium]
MRIDNSRPGGAAESAAASASQRAAQNQARPAAGPAAFGEDQAELSGAHVQVQALASAALQFPEIRQEKVSALRQVVESGRYSPDPEQVAGALMDHLLAVPAA